MANQVTRRIYDFLKDFPPFSLVDDREALMRVAGRVEVIYQPGGTVIFRPGEQPRDRFFVVKEGSVELFKVEEGEEILVDRLGEGDVFGIRPLLARDNYVFLARAAEESLLYAINSEGFEDLMPNYPNVMRYLATSMAGSTRFGMEYRAVRQIKRQQRETVREVVDLPLVHLQNVQRSRTPVTCFAGNSIVEAARRMTDEGVGSVVVIDEKTRPVGIVTDQDLRAKVVTGRYPSEAPIRQIMSQPVICVRQDITLADVQITMLRNGVRHLVQTEDGSSATAVTGIVSEHDVLVLQGNNPAILIRDISRVKSTFELRQLRERAETLLGAYLEKEVSIAFITEVMTAINDEIIRRCIKMGLAKMQAQGQGNPPALFDWLALGSQGRGEQLLRTDQDNALIFENVPEDRYPAVKNYFLQLATYVTEYLNQVGFAYCRADMMASNPAWCLSVDKWQEQFAEWMGEPTAQNMLNTSIFFDFRGVWGDGSLPQRLTDYIFGQIQGSGSIRFLATLADTATQNPSPLTFFRNFVVERSGKHKEQFDLKSRAMRPLTDAARVLVLEKRIGGVNSTFRRFAALAEAEPQNAELFQEAADAYEMLIRLRALLGLRRRDSGRFIKPSELSRVQRLLLRNSFSPVREIQTLLSMRFQLNFLR